MFKLTFKTSNAAFQDGDLRLEVERILGEVAKAIANGHTRGYARDYNGNSVGDWSLNDRAAK